jgi:hypothetical protein
MNPDPSTCLRCAGPVSEITRRCTRCGAERPPPARRREWERSRSAASYVGAAVFAFLCMVVPLLRVALMASVLLLVWHPRTRRLIPAGALLIVAVWYVGLSAAEWRWERAAGPGQGSAFREGTRGRPEAGAATAPSRSGRGLAWVSSRYEAELERFSSAAAVRAGVELAEPPLAWHTAGYAAAASQHPDVERYWKRDAAFTGEMRRTLPAWSDSTLRALAREGGMTGPQVDAVLKGREGGMAAPARWALQQAADSAALAYHRYLVSIDDRVSYDAGSDRAIFARPAELGRAKLLEQRMQAAFRELGVFLRDHEGDVLVVSALPPAH